MDPVAHARRALDDHMRSFRGQLLADGTYAGDHFGVLYTAWCRARWDAGNKFTRSVWKERP